MCEYRLRKRTGNLLLDGWVRVQLRLAGVWLGSIWGGLALESFCLCLLLLSRFPAKPRRCLLLLCGLPLSLGRFRLLLPLQRQPAGTIQRPLPFGSSLLLLSLFFPRLLLRCLCDLLGKSSEIRQWNAGCGKYREDDPALHGSVFLRDAAPLTPPLGSVAIPRVWNGLGGLP